MPSKGLSPDALKIVLELPTNEAVRAAVQADCGATAISELVVEAALRAGLLVAVDYELPARSYLVARHRERYRSKAAQEFLKIVSKLAEPRTTARAGH